MKRLFIVSAALLLLTAGSLFSQRSQYSQVSDTKTASLIVASSTKIPVHTVTNTIADSLTVVAKVSDSVTVNFQFLSTAPDGNYLDNTIIIPSLTSTNAAKYTSATIALGARHQIATLVVDAQSTRSTTAGIIADAVKVWVYYHTGNK